MGACMSKASRIEEQKKDETVLEKEDRKGETVTREIRQLELPYDPETGEEKQSFCNHRGERLSQIPIPCHSTGVNDYKKFATGQYLLDCQQHRGHCFTCQREPAQSEYRQQCNPTRFYDWHAEGTHNAWRNSSRGRGQGASRLNQERNFYTSSPADTYRVARRPRGYRFERQLAVEEKRVCVVPKVTPFLGEDEPIYGRIGGKVEKIQKGEKSEDNETAEILRAAARMFENNDL